MSKYNLSAGLETSFDFEAELDGKTYTYRVKYPNQKELRPIQMGYAELKSLNDEYGKLSDDDVKRKKEIEDKVKKISEEIADNFSSLFTCLDGEKPIAEFLDEAPLNLKNQFDEMIAAEFKIK